VPQKKKKISQPHYSFLHHISFSCRSLLHP